MNLIKRVTAWLLALVMVLGLIPQTAFAEEKAASPLKYEIEKKVNEDKTEATISLKIAETETVRLEKVTLPDGTEKVEDLSSVTYTISENGKYDFKVNYVMEGTPQEETIPVEVSGLEEKIKELVTNQNIELDVDIQLKGATFFDGHPDPFFGGTKQYMISDRSIIPYNGMQLMELIVEIPYQDGLEIQGITPSVASQYPDLSKVEKDDKNKKWTYSFYFYKNGTYEFTIDYILNGENKTTSTSFSVDGLVSIKDIAMRRHLINGYGEFSGFSYQGGRYVTKDILAMVPSAGFFTFGLDGDNGTTAEYTTSLDGLQYLTNLTGLYLFDCSKLAPGETIEPITKTYYPKMKKLRISEIFNNRPNLPEGSYTPEMIAQAISNMPNLSELSMCYTGFVDLPVIGQLNGQLNTLEADHCAIESVEGIEKHPNIQMISLGINKIKSIQPFENANLSNVNFLDLGGNQIFDLRPLYKTLNPNIVGGQRFGANKQTIQYEKTVIANLNGDQYEIELPMPIDIDGSLTDADQAAVGFPDGTQKNYTPIKKEGKTYIFIPKADVDSTVENPFNNMKFAFTFNNKNGVDTRTKGGFSGTVYFRVSPFATKYGVIYDFISGTRGKNLPPEITDLLPIDSTKYYEGDTITAKNPTQLELEVSDGVWTFEGYDADSKTANANSVNEDGNIQFTGTWIFETKKYDVSYKFESINTDKEIPKEFSDMLPTVGSVEHGKTVNAPSTKFDDVKVTDGIWTFKGWTPTKYENVAGDVEFVGKWEFKKNASIVNLVPTISASDKTLTVGDKFDPLKDVSATDPEDGNITLTKDNVIKNEVDTTKAGTYEVTYKVTDSQGASTTKTIKVTVVAKDTPVVPDKPDNGGNKPDTENPNTNKPDSADKSTGGVKTGDNANVMLWGVLLVLSGVGIYLLFKKRLLHDRKR